jgi:hypothetical protein
MIAAMLSLAAPGAMLPAAAHLSQGLLSAAAPPRK